MATSVFELIASTKPAPIVVVDMRKVRTSSLLGTRSWMAALIARSLISDPPGASTKAPAELRWPARSSEIWLMAPVTGFW